MDWNEYFLSIAESVAKKSKDPSTKVGALIVDSRNVIRATGYNGFPRGMPDHPERYGDRDLKLRLVVHAEANAIAAAARVGVALEGCTLYATFHPCSGCAKIMVQAGIAGIVYRKRAVPDRWLADIRLAAQVLRETGLRIDGIPPRNGEAS